MAASRTGSGGWIHLGDSNMDPNVQVFSWMTHRMGSVPVQTNIGDGNKNKQELHVDLVGGGLV